MSQLAHLVAAAPDDPQIDAYAPPAPPSPFRTLDSVVPGAWSVVVVREYVPSEHPPRKKDEHLQRRDLEQLVLKYAFVSRTEDGRVYAVGFSRFVGLIFPACEYTRNRMRDYWDQRMVILEDMRDPWETQSSTSCRVEICTKDEVSNFFAAMANESPCVTRRSHG